MTGTPFTAGAHPTPDQLADFGRGAIDDASAEAIERHLADCAECLRRLEATRDDDPWLALLRAARPPDAAVAVGPAVPVGYELEALIGRGGMGVVHRPGSLASTVGVALKTSPPAATPART